MMLRRFELVVFFRPLVCCDDVENAILQFQIMSAKKGPLLPRYARCDNSGTKSCILDSDMTKSAFQVAWWVGIFESKLVAWNSEARFKLSL
jgi:hypothetical protein